MQLTLPQTPETQYHNKVNILSLFATIVLAAETVISPLGDTISTPVPTIATTKPHIRFGELSAYIPQVLGAAVETPPTPTPTPTPEQTPNETPVSTLSLSSRKSHYTIALLGDSMIDTLGPDAPHFKEILTRTYPQTTFTILNYGVGGENIDSGVNRLMNNYTYLGNPIPSLVSQKPDIVIVESFGYNPYSFEDGAIDRHWTKMAEVVNILKSQLPGVTIIMAATIAPNDNVFGDGAPFINFSPEGKKDKVAHIKAYIESTIKFAKSEKLPLVDAYHPSMDGRGNGKLRYINGGDHIHYSDEGRKLFAKAAILTFLQNRILE